MKRSNLILTLAFGALLSPPAPAQVFGDSAPTANILPPAALTSSTQGKLGCRESPAGIAAGKFPDSASRRGLTEGRVDVKFYIAPDGTIHDITIAASSNHWFNDAALALAKGLVCTNPGVQDQPIIWSMDFKMRD